MESVGEGPQAGGGAARGDEEGGAGRQWAQGGAKSSPERSPQLTHPPTTVHGPQGDNAEGPSPPAPMCMPAPHVLRGWPGTTGQMQAPRM